MCKSQLVELARQASEFRARGIEVAAIIPEPVGGAHRDAALVFRRTGDAVAKALAEVSSLNAEGVRRQRHEKYLAMGRNL